jgi:hypothetical protein
VLRGAATLSLAACRNATIGTNADRWLLHDRIDARKLQMVRKFHSLQPRGTEVKQVRRQLNPVDADYLWEMVVALGGCAEAEWVIRGCDTLLHSLLPFSNLTPSR